MEPCLFPDTLDTERLLLRRYRSEDGPSLLALVGQNRSQLVREFAQMAGLRSFKEGNSFIDEKSQQWTAAKTFCYGIWRKQCSEQIGQIQVKNIAWEIPAAELGYFIGTAWQRQGYASECIRALLRSAFGDLDFQRVFVRILPSNQESFALAKKLGFQEEGLHRKAFRCGYGDLHYVHYLSLIREDYRSRHSS